MTGYLIHPVTAAPPYKPAKPRDNNWIERREQSRKGKYRYQGGDELPEGTFTQSSGQIVNILKSKSKDYKQAMARLTSYINTQGDNLSSADLNRLEKAKEGLRRAYGREE